MPSQVDPGANATHTTGAGPNGTNATATTSAGNESGGGWLAGTPDLDVDVPSVADIAAGLVEWGIEQITQLVAGLIDEFHLAMLTLPVPGVLSDPMTWVTPPDDPYWAVVWAGYWALSAVTIYAILANGVFAWASKDPTERRSRLRSATKALLLIVLAWALVPLYLHTANTLAMGLAPDGMAFLSTPGNLTKFGLGLLGGLLLTLLHGIIVIKGLIIQVAMYVAIYFLFMTLPISLALLSTRNQAARTVGMVGVFGLVTIPIVKVLQAALLWFLFQLPLSPSEPATLTSALIIFVGVYIVLVSVPHQAKNSVLPHTIVAAGGHLDDAGGKATETLKEHAPSAGDVKTRIDDVRSTGSTGDRGPTNGGSSPSPAPDGGQPTDSSTSNRPTTETMVEARRARKSDGGQSDPDDRLRDRARKRKQRDDT